MRIVTRVLVVAFLSIAASGLSWALAKTGGNNTMHAVLVTYENDTPAEQLRSHPDNFGYARALTKVPGFISKTWIHNGTTLGGFHVFTDKASAEAFVNGEMFQSAVVKNPSNGNVQIKHFAVFSELTVASGGSSKTLSGQ